MKLTQILCKQHLQRMARRHWFIQGKKKVIMTKAPAAVAARGIQVIDAVDAFINPPKPSITFDLQAVSEDPLPLDATHPDYKTDPCFIYNDNNVLLAGLEQAQVLTNTVMMEQPALDTTFKIPVEAHDELKKKILIACAFDAEQKKLPKRKDPLRPAWDFPRDYGITDVRKNTLVCSFITRICDQVQKSRDLGLIENVSFSLPLKALGKQIQLELGADIVVTSEARLQPVKNAETLSASLPDLHPLDCTVSIEPQHFYTVLNHYPLSEESKWKHVHTAFVHFNPTQVKNLYDTPVTSNQMDGRLLLKAFSFAAAEARALQKEMKSPVTVQAIQTDGQNFSFAVYQLNTLDIEESEKRNLCWISPSVPLYTTCGYLEGRPVLEGYNPDVLHQIMGFLSKR